MTKNTRRTAFEQSNFSRAEQRKQRLLEAETELAKEDAESLKMTEEQRQILFESFATVKVEFSDLDGLRWTQSSLRKLQPSYAECDDSQPRPSCDCPINHKHSDSTSFPSEDTIRISPSSLKYLLERDPKSTFQLADVPYRRRDGTRLRSPIKNLFSSHSPVLGAGSVHLRTAGFKASSLDLDISGSDGQETTFAALYSAHTFW